MSWITFIWTIFAGICLTLAGLYAFVWLRQRKEWEYLLFTVAAAAAAVLAILEANLMRAPTPAAYGEVLRWMHVSVAVLLVAVVWFIRFFLRAGRLWLAWIITGLRTVVLVPNFLFYPNATFAEISGLHYVMFLGETFSVPVGEMNPWRVLILLSMLLLVLYVLDVIAATWKGRDRRRSVVLGGAVLLAFVLGAMFSELMTMGVLPGPFVIFAFLPIVFAMSFELGREMMRAPELARVLYETQQRMSLAAKAADLELWEWDVGRDEVWVSETSSTRADISTSEPSRLDRYLQYVHPDDRERVERAVARTLEHGDEFHVEFRTVSNDGSARWISAQGQLDNGGHSEMQRLRGISVDITSRKQAEVDLQAHRRDMAHMARVSTLGQLSSALAHEITQPLGAILRNTEAAELFLKKTPPDLDELSDIIMDIRRDEQRVASVIERLRSLFKRRELQLETVEVNELINQVSKLLTSEFQARQMILHVDVPPGLPPVYGDSIHLQQVIMNLILNSMDALDEMPDEKRNIVIRASQTVGGMVELAVIDRGAGIPPEQLPHLFEPFFTTKTTGIGMGLAIARTIIEMHGGKITAENNPQGGATVRFTIMPVQAEGAFA